MAWTTARLMLLCRLEALQRGFEGLVGAMRWLGGGCCLACTTARRRLSLGLYDGSEEAVALLVRRRDGGCRLACLGGGRRLLGGSCRQQGAVDAVVVGVVRGLSPSARRFFLLLGNSYFY
jgi:hypothetical protein